jgi:hypothetical protein
MLNPPDFHKNSGSYFELRKRVLQHVQSAKVEDQILAIVRRAYDAALTSENLLLSRAENKRLLRQVMTAVLDGMLKQLGQDSTPVG